MSYTKTEVSLLQEQQVNQYRITTIQFKDGTKKDYVDVQCSSKDCDEVVQKEAIIQIDKDGTTTVGLVAERYLKNLMLPPFCGPHFKKFTSIMTEKMKDKSFETKLQDKLERALNEEYNYQRERLANRDS